MFHTEGRESDEYTRDTTDYGDNMKQSHNGPFCILLNIIKSEPLSVNMWFFFISFDSCNCERFQVVIGVNIWNR
jgi:hypothetical protein